MAIDWDTYHTGDIQSEYLYRFMSYERLLEFLDSRALYFARMDQFEDKLEGISAYHTSELTMFYPMTRPDFNWNPSLGKNVINDTKDKARKSVVNVASIVANTQMAHWVSCWYHADRESMAMWSLYTKNKGFAIRFKRKQLQDHLRDTRHNQQFPAHIVAMIAGKIVYQDFQSIFRDERGNKLKYLSFRKDKSFEHEKEFRFVLASSISHESNPLGLRFIIPEPSGNLDFSIIANPILSFEEFSNVKTEIEQRYTKVKLLHSELEPWYQLKSIAQNFVS